MRSAALQILLVAAPLLARAQVELPGRVILSGDSATDRQVLGVAGPLEADHGVPAGTLRRQHYSFLPVTGRDTLRGNTVQPLPPLEEGMLFTFVPDTTNAGPVHLELNGQAAIPLKRNVSDDLDSAVLVSGRPYLAVFDGLHFQLLTQVTKPCRAGTWALSRTTCIQALPDTAVNFYTAANSCANRNGRLCTFAEWHSACTLDGRLLATITDYEWVDHAANDNNKAKRVGINAISMDPDCYDGGHRDPLLTSTYRCCFDR
ncbi:MAG: hypothetical protein KDB88_10135 [Flavobacteriales bacterium]|nr:hypothetical protein [Flavobacteriales bacterium]